MPFVNPFKRSSPSSAAASGSVISSPIPMAIPTSIPTSYALAQTPSSGSSKSSTSPTTALTDASSSLSSITSSPSPSPSSTGISCDHRYASARSATPSESPASASLYASSRSSSSSSSAASPALSAKISYATRRPLPASTFPTMESNDIAFHAVLPSPGRSQEYRRQSRTGKKMTRYRQATDDTIRAPAIRLRSQTASTTPKEQEVLQVVRDLETSPTASPRPSLTRRASSMDDIRPRTGGGRYAPVDGYEAELRDVPSPLSGSVPLSWSASRSPIATRKTRKLSRSQPDESAEMDPPASAGLLGGGHSMHAPAVPPAPARRKLSPSHSNTASPRKSPRPARHPASTTSSAGHTPVPPTARSTLLSADRALLSLNDEGKPSPAPSTEEDVFSTPFPDPAMFTTATSSPIPPPRPLKITLSNGVRLNNDLATFDAHEGISVFLRGDRVAVAGLEVSLVCHAEQDETVWELRVRNKTDTNGRTFPQRGSGGLSGAASVTSSPSRREGGRRFANTPPITKELLEKASYFSPSKSATASAAAAAGRDSPRTARKAPPPLHAALSFPLADSPSRTLLSSSEASAIVLSGGGSASPTRGEPRREEDGSYPSTPKKLASPMVLSSARLDPLNTTTKAASAKTAAVGGVDSNAEYDVPSSGAREGSVLMDKSAGFSLPYMALANAYRAAHTEHEGNEEAGEAVYSPKSCPAPSPSPALDRSAEAIPPSSPVRMLSARTEVYLSPRRSPQNRYALYLPPGSSGISPVETPASELPYALPRSDSVASTENTPSPTSGSLSEARTSISTSGVPTPVDEASEEDKGLQHSPQTQPGTSSPSDWHGYDSTLELYASSVYSKKTSGPGGKSTSHSNSSDSNSTKTSPNLSIKSLSPPASPSALLQRRLAKAKSPELQDAFKLGLGVQGAGLGELKPFQGSKEAAEPVPGAAAGPSWSAIAATQPTLATAGSSASANRTSGSGPDADVISLTSVRYKGKQGWSTTEDEADTSEDGEDASEQEEEEQQDACRTRGASKLVDGEVSEAESTDTFGLAAFEMKVRLYGDGEAGSQDGDGSTEMDAQSVREGHDFV